MPHDFVIKIPPLSYLHVQDLNRNVTQLILGPLTLTCLDHQRVVLGPEAMVVIPPRHCCVIENPVKRDESGEAVIDKLGQAVLRYGDREIRFDPQPFPLYPGERMIGRLEPLKALQVNQALLLRADRDIDCETLKRVAGEEWLFEGPATYYPRIDVSVVDTIMARTIVPGQALKLRAKRNFHDRFHNRPRKTGELWLMREPGAYMPSADEEVLDVVKSVMISEKQALHLKADAPFCDVYGIERDAGDHWLVTHTQAKWHIPDVSECVVGIEELWILTDRNYCVIENPCDANGVHQLGTSRTERGPKNFFLQPPYERLAAGGLQTVIVLPADKAVVLQAKQSFVDTIGDGCSKRTFNRVAGEQWLFYGPGEYWPPIEVQVCGYRQSAFHFEPLGLHVFRTELVAAWAAAVVFLIISLLAISSYLPQGAQSIEL